MVTTRDRLVAWPVVSSDLWRDMKAANGQERLNDPSWTPAASVVESDHSFTLYMELPGVPEESLSVDLDGTSLTVSGERGAKVEDSGEKWLLSEIAWGRFERRFRLGSEVDRDGITATYRDGILEIAVPKSKEARPRRIPVSVST